MEAEEDLVAEADLVVEDLVLEVADLAVEEDLVVEAEDLVVEAVEDLVLEVDLVLEMEGFGAAAAEGLASVVEDQEVLALVVVGLDFGVAEGLD